MVIGITGPTGSGKTMICRNLSERDGISVIDCDKIARYLVLPGSSCLSKIKKAFSDLVINEDGTLNRHELSLIVFSDSEKLNILNSIMYPEILSEIQRRIDIEKSYGTNIIFLDAPTLFESGADSFCDRIISVTSGSDTRKARIMERDHLTEEEALSRISSQLDISFYIDHSDYNINNDSDILSLSESVDLMLKKIMEEFQ